MLQQQQLQQQQQQHYSSQSWKPKHHSNYMGGYQ